MGLLSLLFGRPQRRRSTRTDRDLDRKANAYLRRDNQRRRTALAEVREDLREMGRGGAYGRRDQVIRDLAGRYGLPRYAVEELVARSGVARKPRTAVARRKSVSEQTTREIPVIPDERLERAQKLAKAQGGTTAGWLEILERADSARRNPTFRRARIRHAMGMLRNPSAAGDSQVFHGTPRFTQGRDMVLGRITEIDYEVPRGSQRAGLWAHKSGDYGVWQGHGPKPLLVEDPNTRRPQLEMAGSHMTFNPNLGLLG